MASETDPVIELIDAAIPRGLAPSGSAAVDNVTWTIGRGEFWAIGAFAGTGKTDLLCTAAALQKPIRGQHLLFGRDTSAMPEEEFVRNRLKVAMVFSSGRLFSELTVLENIALPLRYHSEHQIKAIADRVTAVLELTGLEDLREKRPSEVQRNMHQRIALARSLALEPEVLLIDNPLLAVDARLAKWWMDFMCQLNVGHPNVNRPMTIVVATDDLRPWTDSAGQFAVLKDKQFQLIGGRTELKSTNESLVHELLMEAYAGE